jgi:hypothetical protein
MQSTTNVKYLSVDKGYGLICRVQKAGKHFVVWTGSQKEIKTGMKVAKKVQELMEEGFATFLEWYDYDMEEWLESNNIKTGGK